MHSSISIPEAAPLDPAASDFRITKWLLSFGWRYRTLWAALIVSTALMAGFAGYLVVLLKDVLDVMKDADSRSAAAIRDLHWLGLKALLLTPAAAAAYGGAWMLGQRMANASTRDLRSRLMAHLVQLDLGFHQRLSRGDLMSRMTSDIDSTGELFQQIFGKVLQRPAEALGTVCFLFYVNWRFAAVVFLALAPAGLGLSLLLRKVSRRSRRARRRQAESFVALEQITSGIRVIKAMGSHAAEQARYDRVNGAFYAAKMKIARARAQSDALVGGLSFALIGAVVIGGALAIEHRISDSSSILAFLTALIRLTTLMKTGAKSFGEIQETLPAAARLFALVTQPSQIVDAPGAPACPVPQREISLEQVRFGYSPGAEILKGLDLKIPVGKVTALVGESGSGKSTILDLLLRFRDVTGGGIRIDGLDIRKVQQASLVQHFSLVAQDLFLFNDTIENNIRYGRPDATPAQVEEAARRAHIHETIIGLPGGLGYQTVVGDRGDRLSGGQRQRIALARALAVEPKVLLLDEPFGALDAKVRKDLRRWLRRLHDELHITSLFVTHDQDEALEVADRIVVMNQGRVEQQGTPEEVYDHPASPFVFEFLGNVNLFHGRAHGGRLQVADMVFDAPGHGEGEAVPAVAYARPHELSVEPWAEGRSEGLPARIVHARLAGPTARLELALEASGESLEADIGKERYRDLGLAPGSRVCVAFPRLRVYASPDRPQ